MFIDFRSDTVTMPTKEMKESVFTAKLGDDVYEEDETTKELQKLASEVTGKEDSIFVPSGVMGNQLCVMSHTTSGNEVILGEMSHIIDNEAGASAFLSRVTLRTVLNNDFTVYDKDIIRLMRPKNNIQKPNTSLVCLENATAMGNVIPLNIMANSFNTAKSLGLSVHLDGARIFNASTYLGVGVKDICKYTDSVMFCLSKGLCAPMGSMVCGTKEFIKKVRQNRKLLGGGQRQLGFVTNAGIIAIEQMSKRLFKDHENAQFLAKTLNDIDGITCDIEKVHINIVFCKFNMTKFNIEKMSTLLKENNIKISYPDKSGECRFVTHNDIKVKDCELLIDIIKSCKI